MLYGISIVLTHCFCFVQVLFNTQPLTQYFKQNMHLYELNTANKLGTKGQLALRYSELLKEVSLQLIVAHVNVIIIF